ncbi:MAG: TetR/AcrR family transcriptional regulator [Bacteroidota bacterium]
MPRVKTFDQVEVLDRAVDLFWKQGYAATSVQDIVNHLGINRASLYDTYGDKEQLFRKAIEKYCSVNGQSISDFLDAQANVREGIQNLFDRAINESFSDEDRKGCFVVNTATELIPGDEYALNLATNNQKSFEAMFLNYLERGKANGQIKTEANLKTVASLLFTLYNGIKVVGKAKKNKAEMKRTISLALSILD